ncbi:MAG TPA: geranylgeranyl reductase family protein [Actinocrinis sp.]|uniref:geranylgeranyl reductase family protein n=1 Tax=Actinocrinis sp. TaxID=1920516 RepID=UPI002DDD460C|nr:geranylgeranyl reductase family protein [Actinocrinis sp.]HEV2346793.1 geranylgeranyl reductase family protein [Actinocrinis sp.]
MPTQDSAAEPRAASDHRVASEDSADVIIVGAGPAGSATAYHLAQAGLDVLLLEKTEFPREKVCGDGLTPRAVTQLVRMGIDTSPQAGWLHNKGLRIIGGGRQLELAWPELASHPNYGLVRPRSDFDELLARQAQKAGARLLEQCNVTAPIRDERTSRITGVTAKLGPEKREVAFHAPIVVAADGNSTRLAIAMGLHKRDDRPMGVAYRAYYRNPRHTDDWLESWLELRDAQNPDHLLPGYGWIFGMGDGTSNIGLGILNTSSAFGAVDYRDMMRRWLASTPPEWQLTEDNRTTPIRGAALPMGFNRKPHYTRGLLLVGDAGGMINPFNGEGIAYAMESGEIAAKVIAQANSRKTAYDRELALSDYPKILSQTYGGYYTLGRLFVSLIGNPKVMRLATQRGLSHTMLMRFTLKLLANLTDPRGGDAMDRIINGLAKVVPSA